MKEYKTLINQKEMGDFFRERCKEKKRKCSDKDIVSFIKFCEIDFFDWLNSNYKHFLGMGKNN